MTALQPFLDLMNPETDELTAAFKAARANATQAAKEYVEILEG